MDNLTRKTRNNNFGTLGDQMREQGYQKKENRKPYNAEKDSKREIAKLDILASKGILTYTTDADETDRVRYVIKLTTTQGERNIFWWPATNEWKPLKGSAGNFGIYTMARYYQVIEKGESL